MKFIQPERCKDMVLPHIRNAKILKIWDTGVVEVKKEDLLRLDDEYYSIYGVELGPSIIGCVDLLFTKHGVCKCGVYLNASLSEFSMCIDEIEALCGGTGVHKLSLEIQTELSGLGALMKDKGYHPEVRLQQHIWDGRYLAVYEYGKLF